MTYFILISSWIWFTCSLRAGGDHIGSCILYGLGSLFLVYLSYLTYKVDKQAQVLAFEYTTDYSKNAMRYNKEILNNQKKTSRKNPTI